MKQIKTDQKYVVGWCRVGGDLGTLAKVYTDKEEARQFAIALEKYSNDVLIQYFVRIAK